MASSWGLIPFARLQLPTTRMPQSLMSAVRGTHKVLRASICPASPTTTVAIQMKPDDYSGLRNNSNNSSGGGVAVDDVHVSIFDDMPDLG